MEVLSPFLAIKEISSTIQNEPQMEKKIKLLNYRDKKVFNPK
jgi:hypothetical protein